MSVAVKICGLTDKEGLFAAVENGASYLGMLFVSKGRQYITPEKARQLLATLPHPTLCRFTRAQEGLEDTGALVLTALFLDASDKEISEACEALAPFLGLIQLHGFETPERVAEIKQLTGLPVMKVFHIASVKDLEIVKSYDDVADMFLFDTKIGNTPSGGTGKTFDWAILKGQHFSKPWMLAGGLTAMNVVRAVKETGATIVDLSSGVETKDKKDPAKIKGFMEICHGL